jgi:hypothetical protein
METARQLWRDPRAFAVWFVVEALLPGAALFALVVWLSQRFVREGFGQVRQHAFAPHVGKWSLTASMPRRWWSCTCDRTGGCTCLAAIVRGLCRGCMSLQAI